MPPMVAWLGQTADHIQSLHNCQGPGVNNPWWGSGQSPEVLIFLFSCRGCFLATTLGAWLSAKKTPQKADFGPCSRERFAKIAKRSRSQGWRDIFFHKRREKKCFLKDAPKG
ncbi:MAG: hypothetical protein HQM01_09745 [Magnetococcales bacterium]|nr:hypothetical protein [Magnetococcales bacterium]